MNLLLAPGDKIRESCFHSRGSRHGRQHQSRARSRGVGGRCALRHVDSPATGDKPTLYFIHVLMPHGPWLYFPDGRVRAVSSPRAPGRTHELWWSSTLATQAWQRHLLQVGYTDKLLGQLVSRLKAAGIWNKALVLVDPDHGISFRGGDKRREPTKSNLSDLAFIPFFVKLPGQTQGRVDDRHVITVDILPTIADVLGIELPWESAGHSLLKGGSSLERRQGREGEGEVVGRSGPTEAKPFGARSHCSAPGAWGPEFAGTGPYRGLVDRPLAGLNVVEKLDKQAVVDKTGSRLLQSMPKNSPLVPSPLTGISPTFASASRSPWR